MKSYAHINIEIPDWMDEAIAAKALEEQTTKNAVVLKALSEVISQRDVSAGTEGYALKEFPLPNRISGNPNSIGGAD